MDHNDVTSENWLSKKNEWSPYLKLDVISLGLVWASYLKSMCEISKNEDGKFIDIRRCISSASFAF